MIVLLCILLLGPSDSRRDFIAGHDFYQPVALKVDRGQRIFVLDAGEHRVWVFDAEGAFLFAFGSKGNGPGELHQPSDLDFLEDGRVVVADAGNRRIQLYNADGGFVKSIKIPNQTVGQILVLPNGDFLLTKVGGRSFSFSVGEQEETKFQRYREGERIAVFGRFTPHDNPLLAVWLNHGAIDLLGEKVVYAGMIQNELIVYDGAKETQARYPLGFVPREPKAEMVQTKMPDGSTSFQMRVEMDQVCAGLAVLNPRELLLLRAAGPPNAEGETEAFQTVKIDFQGNLLKVYEETYAAPALGVAPDRDTAYVVHEEEDGWLVSRLRL